MPDDSHDIDRIDDLPLDPETSVIIRYTCRELSRSSADEVRARLDSDEAFRKKAAPFLLLDAVFRSPTQQVLEDLEDFMRHVEYTRNTPIPATQLLLAQGVWNNVSDGCGLPRSDIRMHRPVEHRTLWQRLMVWPHWARVAIVATIAIVAAAIGAVIYVYRVPRSIPVPAGAHAAHAVSRSMTLAAYTRRDSTWKLSSGTEVSIAEGSTFVLRENQMADDGILHGSARFTVVKRPTVVAGDSAMMVLHEGQYEVVTSPNEIRVHVLHGSARLYAKRTPLSLQLVVRDGQIGRVVPGHRPELVSNSPPAGGTL